MSNNIRTVKYESTCTTLRLQKLENNKKKKQEQKEKTAMSLDTRPRYHTRLSLTPGLLHEVHPLGTKTSRILLRNGENQEVHHCRRKEERH
jgi:hypothetical protein